MLVHAILAEIGQDFFLSGLEPRSPPQSDGAIQLIQFGPDEFLETGDAGLLTVVVLR